MKAVLHPLFNQQFSSTTAIFIYKIYNVKSVLQLSNDQYRWGGSEKVFLSALSRKRSNTLSFREVNLI